MTQIDTTQPIELDFGTFDIVQRQGAYVRLRPVGGGEHLDMTTAELSRHVVGLQPVAGPAPRALETVPAQSRENANDWAGHIREIVDGIGRDGIRRPEYDLASTRQEDRIQLKIRELELHHGITVSRATMMRKLKAYRDNGPAGLIDGRALRANGPLDRLDARVLDALAHVMAQQKNLSTGTRSRLITDTRAELLRAYGSDAPALPSKASMYRYIERLDGGRHTTKSARTRRSLANRPDRTFAKNGKLLPGAEVQLDSTKLDVLIRVPGQKPQRPQLTIMLDVATRSILAWTLRLEATKGVDHAILLAQALVPPQNRPDRTALRRRIEARAGITLKTADELERAHNRQPYVFPRAVTIDNGKDYLSDTFLSAAARYGMDVNFSAPHTPTDKPFVERTFHSIKTLFVQHLPGYTGGSPEYRGINLDDRELFDVEGLRELFSDWVLDWQNRPHSELRDRHNPAITYSPNQMITSAAELTATIYLPHTADDHIRLLPSDTRVITATGVQLNNRHYDSPLLHPLRDPRLGRAKQKWTFHYDPYNPDYLWIVGPDGDLIECTPRSAHLDDLPYATELTVGADLESERAKAAREGTELAGLTIHRKPLPPAPAPPPAKPSDFPTTTTTFISTFDPDED